MGQIDHSLHVVTLTRKRGETMLTGYQFFTLNTVFCDASYEAAYLQQPCFLLRKDNLCIVSGGGSAHPRYT